MPTVTVQLPGISYDVLIDPGVLESVGSIVAGMASTGRASTGRVMVVTDEHVGPTHGRAATDSLRAAGFDPVVATLRSGESHKTLDELLPVFDRFLSAKVERSTPLIAVGGGIVGDMAGFVAATVLRGVPLIQVPTTLLAMVDSSIGGKTGVNHAAGKNLIGAFYQPDVVLADPLTLATLPKEIFIAGLAECIKHFVVRNRAGFIDFEEHLEPILAGSVDARTRLVQANLLIKARVVREDPFEHGVRADLNFGHTFGHAIERASGYTIAHGPAVALGMTAACRLAVDLGMMPADQAEQVIRLIARAGLPTTVDGVDPEAVVQAMAFDKKVRSSGVRFILPSRIGTVEIVSGVASSAVMSAVRSVCGSVIAGETR